MCECVRACESVCVKIKDERPSRSSGVSVPGASRLVTLGKSAPLCVSAAPQRDRAVPAAHTCLGLSEN